MGCSGLSLKLNRQITQQVHRMSINIAHHQSFFHKTVHGLLCNDVISLRNFFAVFQNQKILMQRYSLPDLFGLPQWNIILPIKGINQLFAEGNEYPCVLLIYAVLKKVEIILPWKMSKKNLIQMNDAVSLVFVTLIWVSSSIRLSPLFGMLLSLFFHAGKIISLQFYQTFFLVLIHHNFNEHVLSQNMTKLARDMQQWQTCGTFAVDCVVIFDWIWSIDNLD